MKPLMISIWVKRWKLNEYLTWLSINIFCWAGEEGELGVDGEAGEVDAGELVQWHPPDERAPRHQEAGWTQEAVRRDSRQVIGALSHLGNFEKMVLKWKDISITNLWRKKLGYRKLSFRCYELRYILKVELIFVFENELILMSLIFQPRASWV